MKKKILYFVNVDWFFKSHRISIAEMAQNKNHEIHIVTKFTENFYEFKSKGFILHPINISRSSTNLLELLLCFFKILIILKKVKPDIFHLITIKPVLIGGIASRFLGVPSVVYSISGLGIVFSNKNFFSSFKTKIFRFIYSFALNHFNSKIIVQNKEDLKVLKELTSRNKKSFILIPGSGVNLNEFKFNPIKSKIPIIMFASRFLIDKGILDFLNAAKKVKKLGFKARFVLVGNEDKGSLVSLSRSEINDWVNCGFVEWWGYSNNMPEILKKAHFLVFPSFYGEGLPKILIETAASGRAIITTNWPGCRDAIKNGVTGKLVPIKNVKSLVKEIVSFLDDPEKYKLMGLEGRKRAEKLFSLDLVCNSHLTIYNALISKKS